MTKVISYNSLAFATWRKYSKYLPPKLIEYIYRCWGDDLHQELLLLAWECKTQQLELKPSSNHIQRGIYHFIRNIGWRRIRGGNWHLKETTYGEMVMEEEKIC